MAHGTLEQVHNPIFLTLWSPRLTRLRYFRDNGIDPDTIWTGLCEGDR